MTLVEWYAELEARVPLLGIFVPRTEWDESANWEGFHKHARKLLGEIKMFGLVQNFPRKVRNSSDFETTGAAFRDKYPSYEQTTISVRSLSIERAYRLVLEDDAYQETMMAIEQMDDNAGYQADREQWIADQFDDENLRFRIETSARLSVPISTNPKWRQHDVKFVEVNLDCSDVQIKREFDIWLKTQRERERSERSPSFFTESDLADWHKMAVLPYFDILAIQAIEGKKAPTQNAIARKIFPNEFDVDIVERIRKVTKKKVDYLFTEEVLSQLELQAASSVLDSE